MIIASGLAQKLAIFRQSSVGLFSLVISSCCYCHVARPFLSSLVSLRLPGDDPLLSATTNYIWVYTHIHTHHAHTHTYIYLYISTLLACFFIGIAFRKWFGAYVKYYTLSTQTPLQTHTLAHTHTHPHTEPANAHSVRLFGSEFPMHVTHCCGRYYIWCHSTYTHRAAATFKGIF